MKDLISDIVERWKRKNKGAIVLVCMILFGVVMMNIGLMLAKWPKDKNNWRPW